MNDQPQGLPVPSNLDTPEGAMANLPDVEQAAFDAEQAALPREGQRARLRGLAEAVLGRKAASCSPAQTPPPQPEEPTP